MPFVTVTPRSLLRNWPQSLDLLKKQVEPWAGTDNIEASCSSPDAHQPCPPVQMDMRETQRPVIDEVELMLVNARLRDELEPYRDESIESSINRMPLQAENEYLASMLAWERAPALPISDWFSPPLHLLPPDALGDSQLSHRLKQVIQKLHSKNIVLRCTDHHCDRELYTIIYRDILPCCEKKVDLPGKALEWMCVEDTETWLRFYASAVERRRYQEEHEMPLPPSQTPPHQRELPGH